MRLVAHKVTPGHALVSVVASVIVVLAVVNLRVQERLLPVSASYPEYPSVEELANNADAVIAGTVGDVVSTELDYGGNDEARAAGDVGAAVPVALFAFSVEQVLSSTIAIPDAVEIVTIDPRAAVDEQPLQPGDRVVLAVKHVPPDRADLSLRTVTFAVVSGDNGVFDIDASVIRSRSTTIRGLRAEDVDLDELRAGRETSEAPLEFDYQLFVDYLSAQ